MSVAEFRQEAELLLKDPRIDKRLSDIIFGEAESRCGLLAHDLLAFANKNREDPGLAEALKDFNPGDAGA